MKKSLTLLLTIFIFATIFSQKMRIKDYSNILKSQNIYEINAFLRDAHPDDPRRSVLKPRVMKMMKEYIANAKKGDQRVKELQEMLALLRKRPSTKITFEEMNAIIKQKQIAKYKAELELVNKKIASKQADQQSPQITITTNTNDTEAEEFNLLMNESPIDHKMKTAKILTSLFDNDPTSKECIVMIQNKSDCNIIMRIEGAENTKYRLAVPAKNESSLVIEKGDYLFSSLVCGAQYASQKTIQKALMVSLDNPITQHTNPVKK